MSIPTHAYYLRGADQGTGIALLERSGVGAYVWPAANGWIPLVLRAWARDKALLSALGPSDVLLSYTVVEARGWSFELLSRDKCFLRYARSWTPEDRIDQELVKENLPLLFRLMLDHNPGLCAGKSLAELSAIMRPILFSREFEKPHRAFASFLGLYPNEGLFYDELPSDILDRGWGVVRTAGRRKNHEGKNE